MPNSLDLDESWVSRDDLMNKFVPGTVTASLDDSICGDSLSSHESNWTDLSSDTSSIMAGYSEKSSPKHSGRRVHFDPGREGSKRSRGNRNREDSPSSEAASTTGSTDNSGSQQAGQETRGPRATQPTVPGVPVYNNTAPIPTAGQQVFLHHTGTFNQPFHQAFPHGQPIPPTNFINYPGQPAIIATGPVAMSGYVNPANAGIHFQPQVPDTTNGPYVHTYHPRHDQVQAPAQTYYVPAVGANVYYPPVLQQPVQQPVIQQPVFQQPTLQQPVVYQQQAQVPAAGFQCAYHYASGASPYRSLILELQAAKWS